MIRATSAELTRQTRDYLQLVATARTSLGGRLPEGWVYSCPEDAILKRGVEFKRREFDVPHMTPKQCFDNAYHLTIDDPTLHYCEGFAMGIIPVHHAWVCDDDGVVLDPTWWWHEDEIGREEGDAYVGVVFERSFVLRTVTRTGYPGIFRGGDELVNVPLMRGDLAVNERVRP